MTVVLLNAAGTPEPSPEIQRRLRGVHSGLHLKYIRGVDAHWGVCMTWTENDARRAQIQAGEIPSDKAFDIIGYLPMDCPVEQAPGFLERTFRTFPREDVQRMADMLDKEGTEGATQRAMEEALAEVLDSPDPTGIAPRKRGRPRKIG